MRGLTSVQDTAEALLDKGTREDVRTGDTPQKRQWKYVDHWELAKGREDLLGTGQSQEEAESSQPRRSMESRASEEPENCAPAVIEQPQLVPPTKRSLGSTPPLSFPVKVEEKEIRPETLVESRRRNVSTRFRRA